MAKINTELAESIAGRSAPRQFPVLDASVMDFSESHKVFREDVKVNRILYEFPAGFNQLSLFEECRALTRLDDFETMYDLAMQMLVDKDLVIKIKNDDGSYTTACAIHVAERFQNLRGDDFIDKYPVVITWLCEFLAESLSKKYPLPGKSSAPAKAASETPTASKTKKGLSSKFRP